MISVAITLCELVANGEVRSYIPVYSYNIM